MARQRSKKLSESRKSNSNTEIPKRVDLESGESDNESSDVIEKDEDEDELDRLVLGDDAGFMAELGRELEEDDVSGSEGELEADLGLGGEEPSMEGVDDADLFFLDSGPTAPDSTALIQIPNHDDEGAEGDEPAWEDSDDDRLVVSLAGNPRLRKLRTNEGEDIVSGREYTRRLRQQFQRLNATPEWAISERPAKRRRRSSASSNSSQGSDGMEMDDDDDLSTGPLADLLRNTGSLIRNDASTKRTKLRPEVIDIQRTRDIPLVQPSAIDSLSFHPQYPVILSSGNASTLYMHHISPSALPTPNPQLTSVHIKHTPLHTSAFLGPLGDKIFFSGRRRYFHTWDLTSGHIQKVTRVIGPKDEQKTMERFKLSPCGRYMALVGSSRKGGGVVNILSATTTQWIASARIEGRNGVADYAWWRDGNGLTIASKSGEIGEWSVESRSFLALWNDEGAVGTTVIALGGKVNDTLLGGDRWVVVGSQSGVVNIYDRKSWTANKVVTIPKRPEPTRRLMQLTTPTSCAEISKDGQLLVIASRWKKDALKLVHLPSCTVYRNWPTEQTPFGRICSVAFGHDANDGQMLAVGNEQGKIRLWEIRA